MSDAQKHAGMPKGSFLSEALGYRWNRTSVMHQIDTRFSGIARGIGTAKILGRVHSAQIKIADFYVPASLTVIEVREPL